MPLTKDEVSDLRSLIGRIVQTEIAVERATVDAKLASTKLEDFIWKLENK